MCCLVTRLVSGFSRPTLQNDFTTGTLVCSKIQSAVIPHPPPPLKTFYAQKLQLDKSITNSRISLHTSPLQSHKGTMCSIIQILSAKHSWRRTVHVGVSYSYEYKGTPTRFGWSWTHIIFAPSVAQISNLRLAFGCTDSGPQAQSSREIVFVAIHVLTMEAAQSTVQRWVASCSPFWRGISFGRYLEIHGWY